MKVLWNDGLTPEVYVRSFRRLQECLGKDADRATHNRCDSVVSLEGAAFRDWNYNQRVEIRSAGPGLRNLERALVGVTPSFSVRVAGRARNL